MPIEKAIRQRARLAMGDTIKGYAKGGTIGKIDAGKGINVSSSPRPMSPITVARRNNGVKGMKEGGKC